MRARKNKPAAAAGAAGLVLLWLALPSSDSPTTTSPLLTAASVDAGKGWVGVAEAAEAADAVDAVAHTPVDAAAVNAAVDNAAADAAAGIVHGGGIAVGSQTDWALVAEIQRCSPHGAVPEHELNTIQSWLQLIPSPHLILLTSCKGEEVPTASYFGAPGHVAVINGILPLFYSQPLFGGLRLVAAKAFGESMSNALQGLAWVDLDMGLGEDEVARLSQTLQGVIKPAMSPQLVVVKHNKRKPDEAAVMSVDTNASPGTLPSDAIKFSFHPGQTKLFLWCAPTADIWDGWANVETAFGMSQNDDVAGSVEDGSVKVTKPSRVRCIPPLKNCCEC